MQDNDLFVRGAPRDPASARFVRMQLVHGHRQRELDKFNARDAKK